MKSCDATLEILHRLREAFDTPTCVGRYGTSAEPLGAGFGEGCFFHHLFAAEQPVRKAFLKVVYSHSTNFAFICRCLRQHQHLVPDTTPICATTVQLEKLGLSSRWVGFVSSVFLWPWTLADLSVSVCFCCLVELLTYRGAHI